MFDVPEAKTVRRCDLVEADDEDSSNDRGDGDIFAVKEDVDTYSRLVNFQYDLAEPVAPARTGKLLATEHAGSGTEKRPPQTFEFRLFGSATGAGRAEEEISTKITIRSPTPTGGPGTGRFINPHRARKFYFQRPENLSRWAVSAVSSDDVLKRAQISWPGTALPWRVIHVRTSPSTASKPITAPSRQNESQNAPRKRKPSKKRRILLRSKVAVISAKAESERDNRARKNRVKKLKRREKEKSKKAEKTETDEAMVADE